MAATQIRYCSCGAVREVPLELPYVSCVQCGRALTLAREVETPMPSAAVVATATFTSQCLGTLAFTMTLAWSLHHRVAHPDVTMVCALGAIWVFAGGWAHRGSLPALACCALLDFALAAACLDARAWLPPPPSRIAPELVELALRAVYAVALLAGVTCLAAMPQLRRVAAWRSAAATRSFRRG